MRWKWVAGFKVWWMTDADGLAQRVLREWGEYLDERPGMGLGLSFRIALDKAKIQYLLLDFLPSAGLWPARDRILLRLSFRWRRLRGLRLRALELLEERGESQGVNEFKKFMEEAETGLTLKEVGFALWA
jgi:hypothetical protein